MTSSPSSLAGKRLIRSKEDGIGVFANLAITIAYCAFTFTMFYQFAILAGSVMGGLISGFFAVIGVAYIVWTVRFTLNRMKFGLVNLYVPTEVPTLGGELAGRIVLPEKVASASHARIELHCNKVTYVKDAKGRDMRVEKREWMAEQPFPVQRAGRLASVDFRMAIPDEPVIERGVSYVWEIHVAAELPGLDLSRSFTVRVAQPKGALAAAAARVAAPGQGGFAPAQTFASSVATRPATPMPAARPVAAAGLKASSPAAVRVKPKEPVIPSTMVVADEPPSLLPVVALVIANLVPLAGVLFGGWTVGEVVILYWIENLVIGAMNVARMACARPDALFENADPGKRPKAGEWALAKTFPILFFIAHFGAFCAGHGTFLAILFPVKGLDGREMEIGALVLHMLGNPGVLVAVLGLLVSHLISFFRNYLGREEYRHADFGQLMMRPYGRIIVVHIFIIAGAFIVTGMNSPLIAMVLFVVIKTAVDLHMHQRERKLLAASK